MTKTVQTLLCLLAGSAVLLVSSACSSTSTSSSAPASSTNVNSTSAFATSAVTTRSVTSTTSATQASTPTSSASPTTASSVAASSISSTARSSETSHPAGEVSTASAIPVVPFSALPTDGGAGANLGVFKAEITQVAKSSVANPVGHLAVGTPALRATLKLTNTSDQSINADRLSFPVLQLNDGRTIPGSADASDQAQLLFGDIPAHNSKELSVVFPTEQLKGQIPQEITVVITDPANPQTSLILTHSVEG